MVPIWLQALAPRHTESFGTRLASRATELAGPLFVAVGYALILGISHVHFTKFVPRDSTTHLVASALLASELLLQYSLAIWSNPGYVELEHLADFIGDEEDGDLAERTVAVSFCKASRLFLATFSSSSNEKLEGETEASGPGRLDRFMIFFAFMATSTVGVVLCGYWSWHLYLVLTEQTTVEFMQRQGGRKPLSVTAASARHTLGRMLGRQDAMWFGALDARLRHEFGAYIPWTTSPKEQGKNRQGRLRAAPALDEGVRVELVEANLSD
ncbi:hypothetical protein BBJ28_00006934 [Nothophytophthora sp. Chile5]|nr:hypothetical protein BBJ28_00006934 [Nothophytophthora sp. Chile5]